MPYRFVENEVMVSYRGITIYHIYRNNYEDAGWREYWYTKEPFGCEEDDDAFDVRDLPGYDSSIAAAANLVNMISTGQFGPPPANEYQYVDEKNSLSNHCPVCQSKDLEYGSLEVLDSAIEYPITCNNCGISAKEYANLEFSGYEIE